MRDSEKGDSQRFNIWLEQAAYDLQAADILFEQKRYEWVCYLCIQSVEKTFKSIIVHAGYRPPKTHKLGVLLSMGNRANKNLIDVKFNFRKIESYTFISRYPFVIPGENKTPHEYVRKEDAETCLKIAKEVAEQVQVFLLGQNVVLQNREMETSDFYYTKEEVNSRIEMVEKAILASDMLDVERIILYGSFARDNNRPRSATMDLLVIAETQLEFIDRIEYVRKVTKGAEPIVEALVYTPKEFKYMLEEEGEGYLESAIDEGRVIWEKTGSG
jgi:HEPN domain-containing protein/predicted nucleotidyltransferase